MGGRTDGMDGMDGILLRSLVQLEHLAVLKKILKQFGFTDVFIGCIQNLYTNDYVTSSVNGIKTRPIYLTRGVRQGCSLSPLLFAIYLTSLSKE